MNTLFMSAILFNITTIGMTTLFFYTYYKHKTKYDYLRELLYTDNI